MAIVSRKGFVLRGFMIILWFASRVSGSCLSYGHACWGAHGKRSEVNLIPSKGMIIVQGTAAAAAAAAPSSNNEQRLSRIIDKLLSKTRGESNKPYKINFLSDLIEEAGLRERFHGEPTTSHQQNINEGPYDNYGKNKQTNNQEIMTGIVVDDREDIRADIPPITMASNNEYKQADNKIGIALLRYLANHRSNV